MAQIQVRDTLDTNLIVHYIIGDIPAQRIAVGKLLANPDAIHRIKDLTITEAVYVFETHYGQTRTEIANNLQAFLAKFDDVLDYNEALFLLVFPFYKRHSSLSFNDCVMAFYAQIDGTEPLLTFDKTLAKQHPSAKLLK